MNLVVKLGYGIKFFCDQDFLYMDCNIVEVMFLSFKSCEFSQRDCSSMFCLRTSKRASLGELIDHRFYLLLAMVYKSFKIHLLLYRVFTGPCTICKEIVYLELFGDLLRFAGSKRWLTVAIQYRPTVTTKYQSMLGSSHRSIMKPSEN